MYPLLLSAPIKDYIWGGTQLKTKYGFKTDKKIAAEAWVLSCHKDGNNTVLNGCYAGKSLPEVLNIFGKTALGKNSDCFEYFPLLIKLIDAKDKLSVQVHPDDSYALKNEGEYGKTEMWYVVDCEEGSELIYGFNRRIDKTEFRERIENNTLTEVCNFVPVKRGDVFFISSGTLHAIGKGILIAEVQQNSNTTYRVSDYGRLGADGKPRQLHIDKAVDVTDTNPSLNPYGNIGKIENTSYGTKRQIAKCNMFVSEIIDLKGTFDMLRQDSFTSVVCLEGNAKLAWADEEISLSIGSSVFVPANLLVQITGKSKLLISYV